MLDVSIVDKLCNSVYLVKLMSGELLVTLITNRSEYDFTCHFPYTLYENNDIEEFCSAASDETFRIGMISCVFFKKPKRFIIDKFFEELMENRTSQFQAFILKFTVEELSFSGAIPQETSETIH